VHVTNDAYTDPNTIRAAARTNEPDALSSEENGAALVLFGVVLLVSTALDHPLVLPTLKG
jgi:hypothetical protein